jgi:hypothetical protein
MAAPTLPEGGAMRPGPPSGIVFRRLRTRAEHDLARSLLAAGGVARRPGRGGGLVWFGLWDLAPAEGTGLVGTAATRLVVPGVAELCAYATPAPPPWPGLGDRLLREVADALRADGAERIFARPPGGGGEGLALLLGAGFRAAPPQRPGGVRDGPDGGPAAWLSLEL